MRNWFQMRAVTASAAEILIYDEIGESLWGEDTVSAKSFNEELRGLGNVTEITLRINSPGGSVFDGLAIYNMLVNHPAKVTARIDGIAASAASLIAMAADEIVMPENSFMLIHAPRAVVCGTSEAMLSAAADLDRMTSTFVQTYATRTGGDADEIMALMVEDRLMDATEALERGFADQIDSPVRMAATYSLDKLPAEVRAKFQAVLDDAGADVPSDVEEEVVEESPIVEADTVEAVEALEIAEETAEEPMVERPTVTEEEAALRATANVVSLDEVRAQAETDIVNRAIEIADLCALSGMGNRTGEFIASRKSIIEVRAELMTARVDATPQISNATPTKVAPNATAAWDRIVAELNSRVR